MDLLALLAPIGVLAAALGIFYAIFTTNRVKTTIEVYEKENTAQGKRISTLEHDNEVKEARITSLERENVTLRDLATGRSAIEAFVLVFERSQRERAEEHRQTLETLARLEHSLTQDRTR